eukprot:s601_g15.t1
MLRDKGARIPATLARRRIGLAFRGGSDQTICIRDLLGSVHFDVWPCKPVVTLAFEIYEHCPGLSWQVAFLAVFFGSVDFMAALRARVEEVAALRNPTLRAIFLAAVRGQTQHVAKWFGSGHSWVRLQSNKLKQLGRTIAREELLKQPAYIPPVEELVASESSSVTARPSASESLRGSAKPLAKPKAAAKANTFAPIDEDHQLRLHWTSGQFEVRSLPDFEGRTIFNRAVAEYSDEYGPDWDLVQDSLKGCVVCDLYKTFLVPPDWIPAGQRSRKARTHQGVLHILEETGRLFGDILDFETNIIALSFIGKSNSDRYIQSLINSGVASKFALVIICHKKADKGLVAKDFDPAVAIDDSGDVIRAYQEVEVPCIQVSRRRQLPDCREEIFSRIRQYWS